MVSNTSGLKKFSPEAGVSISTGHRLVYLSTVFYISPERARAFIKPVELRPCRPGAGLVCTQKKVRHTMNQII
jgi:hypothetical protein